MSRKPSNPPTARRRVRRAAVVLALGAGVAGASVASAAPTITINEPDAREYAFEEAIAVDFDCGIAALTCAGTLDGNAVADGDVVTPPSGSHVLRVEGSDLDGTASDQVTFTVADPPDTTPPTGGGFTGPAAARTQSVIGTSPASDPSGVEYAVTLDSDAQPGDGAFGGSPTVPTMTDGAHVLRMWIRDGAGNLDTTPRTMGFTLDSTPPPAPGLAGPPALTRDVTPSFSWSGEPGATFAWSLVRDGGPTVAQGAGTSHTSGALADGAYTFTVTQSDAVGPGAAATRRFTVDSTAPDAPTVTSRPPATGTDRSPAFAWTASEPGPATFTWRLLRTGEGVVEGPTDTITNRATLSVQPGSYTFQVSQTDAVGNAGAYSAAEAFTVEQVRPPDDPPRPPEPPKDDVVTKNEKPKVRNARLMKPRAGARFAAVRPTLRWKKRRGAVLYNLQIFRLNKNGVTKVVTAFPRTNRFKVPRRRLKAGKMYVWRVWPYMSRSRATKKPLGVSYFRVTAPRRR